MINLFHAELFKLRKNTAFKICLIITTLCAITLAFVSNGIATGSMDISVNTTTGLSDIFIMSVIGSLMAGILIWSDFESKNIHDQVSCGRGNIVLSKVLMFILVIMALLLPYAIVGFIGFVTAGSYSEMFSYSTYLSMLANVEQYPINAANIGKAIAVLAVSLLLYAARLSICIPIAFKVRKPVVVAVVGVVFGFIIDFFMSILGEIPVIDTLIEYLPYSYMCIKMDSSAADLMKYVLICIGFLVFIAAITYALFKKAEIK